jgi:hypothetical protein
MSVFVMTTATGMPSVEVRQRCSLAMRLRPMLALAGADHKHGAVGRVAGETEGRGLQVLLVACGGVAVWGSG